MKPTLLLVPAIAALLIQPAGAEDPEVSPYAGAPGWEETREQRNAWFKEAKFGMFIHWGLYSAAGGYWPPDPENGKRYQQHYAEWIRHWAKVPEPDYGQALKPLFQPEPGCTKAWAELAKAAGMRYAVITAKHHEGYTIFNSKQPYSVGNDLTGGTNISPEGRDMFREFAESMRASGVKPGFYYSIIDWQHPDAFNLSRPFPIGAGADNRRYTDYLFGHIDELVTNYGELFTIWSDYSSARWQGSTWRTREILTNVLAKQPHILTNNRWWNGLENRHGDFFSPEKYVPASNQRDQVFEVNHTMNESYGFSYHDKKWKNYPDTLRLLCDIVGKGGNLLLNIGPDRHGRVPKPSVDILTRVGRWLEANGESIYGTVGSPFEELGFKGSCTMREMDDGNSRLYLHVFEIPQDGVLRLTGLENEIASARFLVGGGNLGVDSKEKAITLPADLPDPHVSVVAVDLVGKCKVRNDLVPVQRADRSVVMPARRAVVKGPNIRIEGTTPNVGWWLGEKDSVSFPFVATNPEFQQHLGGSIERRPGTYEVVIEAAVAAGAGGTLTVTLDTDKPQTLVHQVESTGGWKSYKDLSIGKVTLEAKGQFALHFKGSEIRKPGFVNIRSVKLVPTDQ